MEFEFKLFGKEKKSMGYLMMVSGDDDVGGFKIMELF